MKNSRQVSLTQKSNKLFGIFVSLSLSLSFSLSPFLAMAQGHCDPLPVPSGCLNVGPTYVCVGSNVDIHTLAEAISESILVSSGSSSSTPQYVIIDGTFETGIISSYTFYQSDLIFTQGSSIIINNASYPGLNNPNLKIISSTLRGCTYMWAGIDVQTSKGVYIEDSEIFDAVYAIKAVDRTRVILRNNVFDNNHVGFYVPAQQNNVPSTVIHFIDGNIFTGSNYHTKENVEGYHQRPFAGIEVHNLSFLDLDGKVNTFESIHNGIVSFNSNVVIKGESTFETIERSLQADQKWFGNGIYTQKTTGSKLKSTLSFDGAMVNQSSPPNFLNCDIGIFNKDTWMEVKQSYFKYGNTGVLMDNSSKFVKFYLHDNLLFENEDYGIQYLASSNFHVNTIQSNLFKFDSDDLNSGAINVSAPATGANNLSQFSIHDNTFRFSNNNKVGISLLGTGKLLAKGNTLQFDEGLDSYLGIKLRDATANILANNKLDGRDLYNDSDVRLGINLVESRFNLIKCNEISGISRNMVSYGFCDGSIIEANEFGSGYHGFLIGPNLTGGAYGRVGLQPNRGNVWGPQFAGNEAYFIFTGGSPGAFVPLSKFTVHENDDFGDLDYWPNIIDVNGEDNDPVWFEVDTELDEPSGICTEGTGQGETDNEPVEPNGSGGFLTTTETALMQSDTSQWFESGIARDNSLFIIAEKLLAYPDLLSTYAVADSFLSAYTTTAKGELLLIQQELQKFKPDTTVMNTTLSLDITHNSHLDTLIHYNSIIHDTASTAITFVLDTLITEWLELQDSIYLADSTTLSEYYGFLAATDSFLDDITVSDLWEYNKWTCMKITVSLALYPDSIIDVFVDTLKTIAAQCPLTGGLGVYDAVSLLTFLRPDTIWTHGSCAPPAPMVQNQPNYELTTQSLPLFPNPGKAMVTLKLEDIGEVTVTDLYGRIIFNGLLGAGQQVIHTTTWNPGVYLIVYKGEQKSMKGLWIKE